MESSLLTQPTVAPTPHLDFYMRNKVRFCSSSCYLTSETKQQKFLLARKEAEESGGKSGNSAEFQGNSTLLGSRPLVLPPCVLSSQLASSAPPKADLGN